MFQTKQGRPDLPCAPTYSSAEVAHSAQISLRQLQWWDERKLVSPRHEGRRRIYRREEAVAIAVIAELRRKGLSLQKIRRIARFLQRALGHRGDHRLLSDSQLHLLTDGRSSYLETQPDRILDIWKHSQEPMFLVCVSDQVRRIEEISRAVWHPHAA
jgi:DNA-binding transcriptional MerR regulator